VKAAKAGQVEFRAEKAGIVHSGIGKASFTEKALAENIRTLVDAVNKAKPQGSKGVYIKSAAVTSTMGVSLKVDVKTLAAAAA
jgi:large subunit ribosomal protein L1